MSLLKYSYRIWIKSVEMITIKIKIEALFKYYIINFKIKIN